jgi:hypothetical protein
VADQLAGELLGRVELVREPLCEVRADSVALAGEEGHVLGDLIDGTPQKSVISNQSSVISNH